MQLARIGSDGDGGYIMIMGDNGWLSDTKIAYSLGICDDVRWDLEMAKRGYDIYQYDHTISRLPVENKKFHWTKCGITGDEETANLKHIETLIKRNDHDKKSGMILKCDIEGYE